MGDMDGGHWIPWERLPTRWSTWWPTKKMVSTMTTTSTWKSNWVRELITGLVNWAQTFSTRSFTQLAHLLSFASLLKPSLTSSALSTQFEISSGLGVWWMRRARDCQREQSDRSLSSGQLLQWLVTTLSILTISELLKIICKNGPQEWITKK